MDATRMNSPILEAYNSLLKAGKPAFSNTAVKDKKGGTNKSVKAPKKTKTAVMGKPKTYTAPKMKKAIKENAEKKDPAEVLAELNAVSTIAQMLEKMVDYGIDPDIAIAKISLALTDLELFQQVLEKVVADIDEEVEFEDEEAPEASEEELDAEAEEIEAEEEAEEEKE